MKSDKNKSDKNKELSELIKEYKLDWIGLLGNTSLYKGHLSLDPKMNARTPRLRYIAGRENALM